MSHSQILGSIDSRLESELRGWALAPDDAGQPIGEKVYIYADSVLLGHTVCNLYRPDLEKLGYKGGQVGFVGKFPELEELPETTVIVASIRPIEDGDSFIFAETTLGMVPVDDTQQNTGFVSGSIDDRSWGSVTGWASLNQRLKGELVSPLTIYLFANGTKVSTTQINHKRVDLIAKGIGDGSCGFSFGVRPHILSDGNTELIASFSEDIDDKQFRIAQRRLSEVQWDERNLADRFTEAFRPQTPPPTHTDLDLLISDVFQEDYYRSEANATDLKGVDPLDHYLTQGWKDGLNPHPSFDTEFYKANYLRNLPQLEPLTHFLSRGWLIGNDPCQQLSTKAYLGSRKSSGSNAAPMPPLASSWIENLGDAGSSNIEDDDDPVISKWSEKEYNEAGIECFDSHYYRVNYPDVDRQDTVPWVHYVSMGWREGRDPSAFFSHAHYCQQAPECMAEGIVPLVHYIKTGWKLGLDPSSNLNTTEFLERFPESAELPGGPLQYLAQNAEKFERLEGMPDEVALGTDTHREITEREHPPFQPEGLRMIAYYLTQFHPIAENDDAWGRGFTEWTNVSKARPAFVGHKQPILPGELGFYDLRNPEVIDRQIELAKLYGLGGWCFYYYWFSGRRLLERPFDLFLSDPSRFDFPFMIMWANENWTRRWDGMDGDVIVKQEYSNDDPLSFIKDVEPVLLDSRYIHIDEKPVLAVYKPDLIPDFQRVIECWRDYWKQKHGELYIVIANTTEEKDPRALGCDAMVQFPPNGLGMSQRPHMPSFYGGNHGGNVFSYDQALALSTEPSKPPFPFFRCSFPSWDNTSRRPQGGDIFIGSSPDKFRKWTSKNIEHTLENLKGEEQLVFVNAWNEWAEGAILEPSLLNGYANLGAMSDSLVQHGLNEKNKGISRKNGFAALIHLFHPDLLPLFASYLKPYLSSLDLYFTVPIRGLGEVSHFVETELPGSTVIPVENRGRDVAPFIHAMEIIEPLGYDWILKIHSKKSLHRHDGIAWLNDLLAKLLPQSNPEEFLDQIKSDSNLGVVGPAGHAVCGIKYGGSNVQQMLKISSALDLDLSKLGFPYFAGTMFWFRPQALSRLWDKTRINFFDEFGQIDGTPAHAIERLIPVIAKSSHYNLKDTDMVNLGGRVANRYHFATKQTDESDFRISYGSGQAYLQYHCGSLYATDKAQSHFLKELSDANKIALVALYRRDDDGLLYRKRLCKALRNEGYKVVTINALWPNTSEWFPLAKESDLAIVRYNEGYDFGSWIDGFTALDSIIPHLDELLLINDSCYGPIEDIPWSELPDTDVVSLTESQQFMNHMQSNFLLIRNRALRAGLLQSFRDDYDGTGSKLEIVVQGEIGFTKATEKLGLSWASHITHDQIVSRACEKWANSSVSWERETLNQVRKTKLNPLHYFHRILVEEFGYPFLKRDLLRSNPSQDPILESFVRELDSEFLDDLKDDDVLNQQQTK